MRFSLAGLCIGLAVLLSAAGCKSDKRGSVSSQAFLAPQPLDTDPDTGVPTGLVVTVDKLDILREIHRQPNGQTTIDSVLLDDPAPNLTVLGKLDSDLLLVADAESRTWLTINLRLNTVVKVLTREQVLALFRNQAQKPSYRNMILLGNGWILGYEEQSDSLFGVRKSDTGGVLANQVLAQSEMQAQIFPNLVTKPAVTIQQLVEFLPNEVLMVPASLTLLGLHHLHIQVETLQGQLRLGGRFILLPPPEGGNAEPFLPFRAIRDRTGNVETDVREFPPTVIPGTNRILLFDKALLTSGFLELVHRREDFQGGSVLRASVELTTRRSDIIDALEQGEEGGETFNEQFAMNASFLHPNALLSPANPQYESLILVSDDETNAMFAYDWTVQTGRPGKLTMFSTPDDLISRTDLRRDPDLDVDSLDPRLSFAVNDLVGNRLSFDFDNREVVSLNYDTGQWVVVLHPRDISGALVGQGFAVVNVTYLEALSGDHVVGLLQEAGAIVSIPVAYRSVPVVFPR